MTAAEIRQKVVETASSFLGCREADGSHRAIIDIYNAHKPIARNYRVKYADPWCATFISAIAIKCGLTDIMPTECSCTEMIGLYKKIGRWKEADSYTPQIGDIVMYDWHDSGKGDCVGAPDHVGFVFSVSGNSFTVIEGNIADSVGKRMMTVDGKNIRGFCLPDYASKATAALSEKPGSDIAHEVIDGKWGNGEERKKRLRAAGYDPKAVQNRVNELLKS